MSPPLESHASPTVSGPADEPPLGDRLTTCVGLLLLAAASTQWLGYRFGGSNHGIQIAILKHYIDPTLYAKDLLLESLDGYATYYCPLMAALARWTGNLQATCFAVFVAAHAASLAAVYLLATRVGGPRSVPVVACLLYLTNPGSLAGEGSLTPRLLHGSVAGAGLLWSIWLYLRGRRLAAFVLCGLMFNLHALYALYVAALLAVDSAFDWRETKSSALQSLGALLLPALPGLVWILGHADPIPSGMLPLWLEIMRERSGLHTFPSAQPAASYAGYLLFAAVGGLALLEADAAFRRTAWRFLLAVVVLCLLGWAFSEWRPLPFVIKAQLLRSTKWATYILLLPIARLLAVSWERGGLARIAGGAFALGLLLVEPSLLGIGLLLYLLAARRRWPPLAVALGAATLAFAAGAGAMTFSETLDPSDLATRVRALVDPRIVVCLALWLVVRAAAGHRWQPAAVGVALAALGGWVLPSIYHDARRANDSEPWNGVQAWVREHTPKDAVILTPPYREGFRVFSERAIVGEWKDGTQQFFDAGFGFAWRQRMAELGGRRHFDQLDAAGLVALGRQYGATYAVLRSRRQLPLPKLYQNPTAVVYALAPEAPAEPAR